MERNRKNIKSWTLWLVLGVLMTACSAGRVTSPETYKGEKLVIGSGGGFTGAQTEYVLLDNGQVFKREINGTQVKLSKMPMQAKDITASDFARAKALQLDMLHVNIPGNMYSYLEYQTPTGTNRLVWNEKQEGVPPPVIGFYDFLKKTLTEEKH